eukprot:gnl/MRDRNA2_/MRDRNA2_77554_c0_seq1.p1 gnl/MRDRNA2_/MRDRNA2_77554_c0~~gnl/MRDRNA2_/MRDRNA2_77554_c0_seq1.p1  ORF type:complete len:528 (-),score=85.23 gnl/MRDRNA2_/MRDRNA2_77554_c0_seq1:134-1717(-)
MMQCLRVLLVMLNTAHGFDAGKMRSNPRLTPSLNDVFPDVSRQRHEMHRAQTAEKSSLDALLSSMLGAVSLEIPESPHWSSRSSSEESASKSLFEKPANPQPTGSAKAASVSANGDSVVGASVPLQHKSGFPRSGSESLAQTAENRSAEDSDMKPIYGHILPWWASHWVWSPDEREMKFVNNYGVSQGRLDPPGLLTKSVASSEDMVKAVDVSIGTNVAFDEDSVNNEEILKDAQLEPGGWWGWGRNDRGWGLPDHPVWNGPMGKPEVPGQTRFFHAQWKDAKHHLPSAYEPDFFRDNSEYFGPFRIDYNTRTIWLDDFNFHVWTPEHWLGHGNMAVGPNSYLLGSFNSFIVGTQNMARGGGNVVMGGEGNVADGAETSVIGGEGNFAKGAQSVISGGYHNAADADFSEVVGGDRNVVEGQFGTIVAGGFNSANKLFSVAAGGRQNAADDQFTTVGGGWGNKGNSPASTIGGGAGERTKYTYEMQVGRHDAYLQNLHAEMEEMNKWMMQTSTSTQSPTDEERTNAKQ